MTAKKRTTRAAITTEDGVLLAVVYTDLPSGYIEYAWHSRGESLINPRVGKLTRAKRYINVPHSHIWEGRAECISHQLRRFRINTFQHNDFDDEA